MVVANQPDMVVVDKQKKKAVVVNVVIPVIATSERRFRSNIQGLKEELGLLKSTYYYFWTTHR